MQELESALARSTDSSIVTKCAMVMDVLSQARQPLAFSEIVQATGFVKSSCHRILAVLQGETLVAYDQKSRTYMPGPRLHEWARSAWRRVDLQQAAAPEMADLSDRTAMNTALSVLDGDTILYLRTVDYLPFRLASRPGDHAPLHCTAAGKVFLAHMSKTRRMHVLPITALEKFTEFTEVMVYALEEAYPQILAQGYATAIQEEFLKVLGLAAPIRNSEGVVTACLSLWSMGDHLPQDEIETRAATVISSANAISRKLGWADQ
jgi:DNA-binding IclR family transcriptional regulator